MTWSHNGQSYTIQSKTLNVPRMTCSHIGQSYIIQSKTPNVPRMTCSHIGQSCIIQSKTPNVPRMTCSHIGQSYSIQSKTPNVPKMTCSHIGQSYIIQSKTPNVPKITWSHIGQSHIIQCIHWTVSQDNMRKWDEWMVFKAMIQSKTATMPTMPMMTVSRYPIHTSTVPMMTCLHTGQSRIRSAHWAHVQKWRQVRKSTLVELLRQIVQVNIWVRSSRSCLAALTATNKCSVLGHDESAL